MKRKYLWIIAALFMGAILEVGIVYKFPEALSSLFTGASKNSTSQVSDDNDYQRFNLAITSYANQDAKKINVAKKNSNIDDPSKLTQEELMQINQQIAKYSETIEYNPNDKDALYKRAELYSKKGFYSYAVADYSAVIKLDDKNADAYLYRAIAQNMCNNTKDAINDYTTVITLNPKNAVAYDNRGLLYLDKKDFDDAKNDFDNAITINPQYVPAYYNRALLSIIVNNFADAEQDLRKALNLCEPNYLDFKARIIYRLAVALYHQNKYQETLSLLNTAIDLSPNNSMLYLFRALVHDKLGNKQQAFEDRNKAQEINLNDMLWNSR